MRTILSLLLFASVACAQFAPPPALVSSKKPSAGGGCTTTEAVYGNTGGGDTRLIGYGANFDYQGSWFYATNSATICKVALKLRKNGSPTMNVRVQIHNYTAGSVGTAIGTQSDAVSASTFGASYGMVEFPNLSASLTSGTDYVLVVSCDATDAANFFEWDIGGIDAQAHDTEWVSADGSSWSANDIANLTQGVFILYK